MNKMVESNNYEIKQDQIKPNWTVIKYKIKLNDKNITKILLTTK